MKENIEEDLKKIESLIECFRKAEIVNLECKESMYQRCNYSHYKALENILSDYKRVLKENEEWQRAYQEEKDKQFELVRENQKLQKENEELKEYIMLAPNLDEMTAMKYRNITEEAYIKGRAEEQQKAEQIIYEHYIPKQKIKDKIEELKEKPLKIKANNKYYYKTDAYNKIIIQVLQELLEEKGE